MILSAPEQIVYPSSDGKRMAENTLQYKWITTIKRGLAALDRHRNDDFVAGDLLWDPVEGNNKIWTAPDTMVVFGKRADEATRKLPDELEREIKELKNRINCP